MFDFNAWHQRRFLLRAIVMLQLSAIDKGVEIYLRLKITDAFPE
jgi:hypothetical protein